MGKKELQDKYNKLRKVFESQISILDDYRKEIKELKNKRLSVNELIDNLPSITPLKTVTRVEVVDKIGRAYSNWDSNNEVSLSFQDSRRTLKIFIN